MIDSLLIKNFQSHKETHLKFDKGVNVIVGPTDSGKTAIIRSLQWLIWNKPAGNAFRSKWEGDTVVKVWGQLNSNEHIERGINDKGGYYYVHAKKLEAFGQSVPVEVSKSFNMSEVNLQQQLDSPFLLSETPGKVAEFFNKVANLDKIDKSRQFIQSQIKVTNTAIAYDEKLVKQKQEELKQYDNLVDAETSLKELEKLDKKKINRIKTKKELQTALNYLETIEDNLKEEEKIIKAEEPVNKLLIQIQQRKETVDDRIKISSIILKIKEKDRKIAEYEEIVVQEQSVTNLLQQTALVSNFKAQYKQFYNIVNKIHVTNKKLFEIGGKLKELENKWHDNFPDICPLCGTKINKK